MDRRRSYYLVFDTETANTMDDPLVYDIGGAIVDKQGNVYETFSYVIYDVYCLMEDIMQSAYYSWKLPRYEIELQEGQRKLANFLTVKHIIARLCEKWNVKACIAHNARFDYKSTTRTTRYLTKSKVKYFLPYGIPLWDTLKMANDTICKQKAYKMWCKENNYLCRNGRVKATAEILYRYITKDHDFVESHTGLEDVLIEKEIFAHCMRQHKKMRKSVWE